MEIVINAVQFIALLLVMWFSSGMVVMGVHRIAKSARVSTFIVSFFVLGVFTSITEFSIGINSILQNRPEIFVGNLIGGSFVLMMLAVPLLAILNRGIALDRHIGLRKLLLFLFLILSPAIVTLDRVVTYDDAILLIILYGVFIYFLNGDRGDKKTDTSRARSLSVPQARSVGKILLDVAKVAIGIVLIYFASSLLITTTVSVAGMIGVPALFISLLAVSIGSNIPEIVIAICSVKHKHSEIAFGDYIGSASLNPVIFGVLTLFYGEFALEVALSGIPFLIMLLAYGFFFMFVRSKKQISVYEGLVLFAIFIFFVLIQLSELIHTAAV